MKEVIHVFLWHFLLGLLKETQPLQVVFLSAEGLNCAQTKMIDGMLLAGR